MKKIFTVIMALTFTASFAFASLAATPETEISAEIPELEVKDEKTEILSTEYVLKVNHLYRFFQGSDDSQKSAEDGCIINEGDTIAIGGLSELVVTVDSIKDDTLSFTTNYSFVIHGTEDYSTSYTLKVGEELYLVDMGICDAASEYILSLEKVEEFDTENFKIFNCDMDGDGKNDRISFTFLDNGDEAPSINEILITSGKESYKGYIEQSYDLASLKAITNAEGTHLEAEFTIGDFYGHDNAVVFIIILDDKNILVEKL